MTSRFTPTFDFFIVFIVLKLSFFVGFFSDQHLDTQLSSKYAISDANNYTVICSIILPGSLAVYNGSWAAPVAGIAQDFAA